MGLRGTMDLTGTKGPAQGARNWARALRVRPGRRAAGGVFHGGWRSAHLQHAVCESPPLSMPFVRPRFMKRLIQLEVSPVPEHNRRRPSFGHRSGDWFREAGRCQEAGRRVRRPECGPPPPRARRDLAALPDSGSRCRRRLRAAGMATAGVVRWRWGSFGRSAPMLVLSRRSTAEATTTSRPPPPQLIRPWPRPRCRATPPAPRSLRRPCAVHSDWCSCKNRQYSVT